MAGVSDGTNAQINAQIRVGGGLRGAGDYANGIAARLCNELDAQRSPLGPVPEPWYRSEAATMYQDDVARWNLRTLWNQHGNQCGDVESAHVTARIATNG
jgi:hypothetical protein